MSMAKAAEKTVTDLLEGYRASLESLAQGTASREELRQCLVDIQEFLRSRQTLSNGERLLLLNMINAHLL